MRIEDIAKIELLKKLIELGAFPRHIYKVAVPLTLYVVVLGQYEFYRYSETTTNYYK
jgi:hypothetical protein